MSTPFQQAMKRLLRAAAGELSTLAEQLAREGVDEMERIARNYRPLPLPRTEVKRRKNPAKPEPAAPAPGPTPEELRRQRIKDMATAAVFLSQLSDIPADQILTDLEQRKKAYRAASRKTHPDRGGSVDISTRVNWAKGVLDDDKR